MPGMESLQALLKLKSPSSFTPSGDDYYDKRHAAIVGGEADLEPSELELMGVQDQMPGMSRDRIRDSAMQHLRRTLGLKQIEHQQDMEKATAPEQIRGQYGLKAAELEGQMTGRKMDQQYQMNREDNDARMAQVIAGIQGRQGLQDDQQQFKAGQINPGVLSQIAREEQALRQKASDPKLQPGLLSKIPVIGGAFTPKNPYQEQLSAFTGARQFAQRVYQQYPGMSAEDIAALEGEDKLTPQELQLVNRFLMQFRGR